MLRIRASVMARQGRGLYLLMCWGLSSCARSPAQPPDKSPPPGEALADWPQTAALARYRSKRLGVSIGLPDGRSWRIDDHSRPELVATHASSRSRVVVAVIHADEIVGRGQCERLAGEANLLPMARLWTIEEETLVTQGTFDTSIRVALQATSPAGGPLVGHVMAFGGYLRKCYVFDFSTEVAGPGEEPALSSRLAYARARIFGGLQLDSLATFQGPEPRPSSPEPHPPSPGPVRSP